MVRVNCPDEEIPIPEFINASIGMARCDQVAPDSPLFKAGTAFGEPKYCSYPDGVSTSESWRMAETPGTNPSDRRRVMLPVYHLTLWEVLKLDAALRHEHGVDSIVE